MQFPDIAAEIDRMAQVDQDMRGKFGQDESWDWAVDRRNTARMKEVVAQIGWPTVSKVGERSSSNAWLLVQHADHDIEFQGQCLARMKIEPAGEVALPNIAMLEDRVRVNLGLPQLYGTQFRPLDGKHVPLPIQHEADVDKRRAAMGLGTLAQGIASMYESYGPPKQT